MNPQSLSWQDLKAAIISRHGSIHAFCRRHAGEGAGQLKRSTVYMVLAGRYPGKVAPQLAKICAALAEADGANTSDPVFLPTLPSSEVLTTALQNIRCKHCRTLDKSRCGGCRVQTSREAEELNAYLAGGA